MFGQKKPSYDLKPIEAQIAFNEVAKLILGDDWYIVDPLCNIQANAIALDDIKCVCSGLPWKIFKLLRRIF